MKTKRATFISSAAILAGAITSFSATAAEYSVTVTNLTRGIYFTPLLVAAHDSGSSLFSAGQVASANLQAMAEGGDIAGLDADLQGLGANTVLNPASGLLEPGASTTTTINTDNAPSNTQLSVVAMMLPTNDGFVGLNAVDLPTSVGHSVTFNVPAYDAGTEANDEIRGSGMPGVAGYPAPGPVDAASGNGGTGVNASIEGHVHIHRNVLGDFDNAGGTSDIDATVHRWLNPVARITVELTNP